MGMSRKSGNRRSRPSPRRPQRKGRWDGQGSWRWWAAVALLLVLAIVLGWALVQSRRQATTPDEVGCSAMEQLTYHVHAHLAIFVALTFGMAYVVQEMTVRLGAATHILYLPLQNVGGTPVLRVARLSGHG